MRRCAVVAGLVAMAVFALAGCPFRVGTVQRPPFNNPFDPEFPLTVDAAVQFMPDQGLRDAVRRTGKQFVDDVHYLSIDAHHGDVAVADITGIHYLRALKTFRIVNRPDEWTSRSTVSDFTPLALISGLERIDIFGEPDAGPDMVVSTVSLQAFAGMPSLRALALYQVDVFSLAPLYPAGQLRELLFIQDLFTDWASLAQLTAAPTMEQLAIGVSWASGSTSLFLDFLAAFGSLQRLEVRNGKFESFTGLTGKTSLRELRFEGGEIVGGSINAIGTLTGLTDLDLSWININDLSPVLNLLQLRRLRAQGLPVSTAFVSSLAVSLSALNELAVSYSGTDLAPFGSFGNMQNLHVAGSGNAINADALAAPPLRRLRLEGFWLGFADPPGVVFAPTLKELELVNANLDPNQLPTTQVFNAIVTQLPELERLDLSLNSAMTSISGLVSLGGLTVLRDLLVRGSGVDSLSADGVTNGMLYLATNPEALPALRYLDVASTSAAANFETSGIAALATARPSLYIRTTP